MLKIKPNRTPPVTGALSVALVQKIFEDNKVKNISLATIEALTHELSRPWRKDYKHGVWELHVSARVILDDAPEAIRAEKGHSSLAAQKREVAYSLLLEGARLLAEAGVKLPEPSEKPPKTKQAKSLENRDHRDWFLVFDEVCRAFETNKQRGTSHSGSSSAIKITLDILKHLKINVSDSALTKALDRRRASTKDAKPYRLKATTRVERDK